jgi:predicted RNase H-like nuclease (RuvC/YqgF family)
LFEENKLINLLTRKIQINPSKLELIQYQKRFEELYEQINLINEKNRELINEINSKEEIKLLLQQKLNTFSELKRFLQRLEI